MSCKAIYDFCLYEGDDIEKRFRYKDANGQVIDITGYTITLECSEPQLTKTATIDPVNTGEFYFTYIPTDFNGLLGAFNSCSYPYDVVVVPAATTKRETFFKGTVTVEKEIS